MLKALLPETGTDIRGTMRSHAELLAASGYGDRPRDFDDLVRILDSEIRLITPTEPEGRESSDDSVTRPQAGQKYLPIDARLSGAFAAGLADPQTERNTARPGRAETVRHLGQPGTPSRKTACCRRGGSTSTFACSRQEKMDRAAAEDDGQSRGCTAFDPRLLSSVLSCWFRSALMVRMRVANEQESTRIEGLVGRLVSAEPNQIPDIVKQLDTNPQVASTFLSPLVSQTATTLDEKRAQLHARLAMISRDPSLVDPLAEELLTGKVTYVAPIRQQLRPAATGLTEKFRGILRDQKADTQRRFRAALALADYVPESDAASWTEQDLKIVADQLVASNAEFQPLLRDALRPIRARLLGESGADLCRPEGDRKPAAKRRQRLGGLRRQRHRQTVRTAHGRDSGSIRRAVSDRGSQPRPGHGRATWQDRGHGATVGIGVRSACAVRTAAGKCRGDAASAGRARERAACTRND